MAWIANGESGASIRPKLNALMIPISSVTVSTPVEYVDIAMPSGYPLFTLTGIVNLTQNDDLAAAFSADAGATFFNDVNNEDTYTIEGVLQSQAFAGGSGSLPEDAYGYEAVMFLSRTLKAGIQTPVSMLIDAGATGQNATVMCDSIFKTATTFGWKRYANMLLAATGRQNVMRITPSGNIDVAPPTSGHTIAAGTTLSLFGIPA